MLSNYIGELGTHILKLGKTYNVPASKKFSHSSFECIIDETVSQIKRREFTFPEILRNVLQGKIIITKKKLLDLKKKY